MMLNYYKYIPYEYIYVVYDINFINCFLNSNNLIFTPDVSSRSPLNNVLDDCSMLIIITDIDAFDTCVSQINKNTVGG